MYQNIVVAVDSSALARQALTHAVCLARQAQATLHVVHVVNMYELVFEDSSQRDGMKARMMAERHGEEVLTTILSEVDAGAVTHCTKVLECWGAGSEIAKILLNYANEQAVDMMVMGTHGRTGLAHLLMGSVAESVLREAKVPVVIVRAAD